MKRESCFDWKYSGIKLFVNVAYILEIGLNMDENFLLQEKVSITHDWKTQKNRSDDFSSSAILKFVRLFFNPWKPTFSSSSLEIISLYIKDRFSYIKCLQKQKNILLSSS